MGGVWVFCRKLKSGSPYDVRQRDGGGVHQSSGGTLSEILNSLTRNLLTLCDQWKIVLLPVFFPSHRNVWADTLSRRDKPLETEWSLLPQVVQRFFHSWGPAGAGHVCHSGQPPAASVCVPFPSSEGDRQRRSLH